MAGIKIITSNFVWKAGFAFLLAITAAAPFGSFPAEKTANVERVDLFELTYAYEACEIEHTEIQRHGPHWVWWKKDTIFCLIDAKQSSWIQTSGDTDFAATFRLKAPVNVSRVSITTKTLFKSDEYDPVRWILEKLDAKGNVAGVVAESTAEEPKDDEIRLTEPTLLQFFRLKAFPVDEKGSPLDKGKKTICLSDLSLSAEQKVAFVAVAPAPHLTFDSNFYPFVTSPKSEFQMRVWKIFSTGQSFEDADGLKWRSSNNKVATVDSTGLVRTLATGETTITAELDDTMTCSRSILVQPEADGEVDVDVIYVERWTKDKDGKLIKRDWGEEIDDVQPGESLVFRAHIINAGQRTAPSVEALWWMDDKFMGSKDLGQLAPAGGLVPTGETIDPKIPLPKEKEEDEQQFEEHELPLLRHENEFAFDFLEFPFDGKRHTIVFRAIPAGGRDSNPDNNTLTVWSDAITFGFYMSEYPYFAYNVIQRRGWQNLPEDFKIPHKTSVWGADEWNTHSSTSYDRIQRITRVFNRQFEISKHELTPDGITERLNCIMYIIPDPEDTKITGANCNRLGKANRTIDLIWGLVRSEDRSRANYTCDRMIELFHKGGYPYIDTPLIHEVSHARYLIDLYGGAIQNREIHILDDRGDRVFPDDNKPVYDRKLRFERVKSDHGNMVGGMGYVNGWSEHGAYSWERIRGRRAREGTWNASPELGEFLNTIPDSNVIKIVTPSGEPMVGANIDVYQSVHGPWSAEKGGGIYAKNVDNEPDITVTTGAQGEAEIGPYPFAPKEKASKWHPKAVFGYNGEVNAILKITYGQKSFYRVLTAFDSNLGYWHKYGLQVESWPQAKVRPDSKLTYQYTVDQEWTEEEEKENRAEIPEMY